MDIIIVSELFFPKLRGGEVVLWRLAKGLTDKGHSVRVLTSHFNNTSSKEIVHGVEILRPCEVTVVGKSKTFHAMAKKISFMKQLYKCLSRIIEEKRPDIILNNAYTATLPASFAGKKYNLPVVTNIGNFQGFSHFKDEQNPVVALAQIFKEKFVIRFGGHQGIRVASKAVAKRVGRISSARVFAIPSPIDDEAVRRVLSYTNKDRVRNELGIQDEEMFLLHVGALEKVKNLDSLIETLSGLNRPFKLIIVGDGREKPFLIEVAGRFGISDKVKFLGSIKHEKVLRLMRTADALIVSSQRETGPLVVIEALTVGTPVISTNVGIVNELNSRNLTVVGNVGQMCKILEEGINSHSEQKILERYSVKSVSQKFEKMFQAVIDNVK
jgi:1,2-diacylglycerol 3-alpha-glucosyltransferase